MRRVDENVSFHLSQILGKQKSNFFSLVFETSPAKSVRMLYKHIKNYRSLYEVRALAINMCAGVL